MRITKSVAKLEPYVPGEQPKSHKVVKLNTNENPYPPSPKCAEVLKNFNLENLRRYPDPECTALRVRIAKIWHTNPRRVFVGNGSDEILSLAARAFVENNGSIGSLDPSYSLYKTLAAIRDVPWKASKQVSLFLWTNPNAPTGIMANKREIIEFAAKFKGVLIVDEAYADFAEWNCVDLATASDNRNLIVMRTFSKSFSLAGLRVGYCIGPEDLIEALYKVKDSYNVDAVAQAVALAALNDLPWMRRNVAKVRKVRAATVKELTHRGWDVLPSASNFIFAKPVHRTAAEIFATLRERGVFVRYFPGPKTGDYLRITIGTDEQMKILMKVLDELDR